MKMTNLLLILAIIASKCQLLLLLLRCAYAQYYESHHDMMLSTSKITHTYVLRGTGYSSHTTKSEIIWAPPFPADAAHPLASQSSVYFEKRGE